MSEFAPKPIAPPQPRITIDYLLSILAPWRGVLLAATVSVVTSAGLSLVPPLIMRRLIDDNLRQHRSEGLLSLGLLYLAATAGLYLLSFATTYLTTIAAQGALRQLRIRLFSHLQELPISYYDRTPLGHVISRCTADVDTINTLFSSGLINVLSQALRLVATFIAMIALSPLLSSVMIIVLPILFVITRAFQVRMREAERAVRRAVGVLNAKLQEALTGVEVIRAFHWEFAFVRGFRRALHETLRVTDRSIGYGSAYSPFMNILSAVLIASLFWLSASRILAAIDITIGTLTAFVLLFEEFFKPIISIGNDWQVVQGALAGVERIVQILSLPTDGSLWQESLSRAEQSEIGELSVPPPRRDEALVEVRRVHFGYFPGQEVLAGVSLVARPGDHIAIVGHTGAGKSSLFHLLGGLYRPRSGTIRLAGKDPCALSLHERRAILGPVPQIVQLFSGTVLENLTLGDAGIPFEAVERAAAISGADVFIRELPEGYATVLSESRGSGAQISVGQRQLMALTRALVGNPDILLLDEATASVDGATEAVFKKALQTHLYDRRGVVLTIAHRLSTALDAGYIIVLEKGRVIEEGPPDDLLARGGLLASLWELENAGWRWRVPTQQILRPETGHLSSR